MIGERPMAVVRAARRLGWGLADQGLSSLTNFVLGVVVARTVGVTDFGAFGLAFAAYLIVSGLSRAVTAQPLLIRYSGVNLEDWRRGTAAATGTALLVGLAAMVVSLLIAILGEGSLRLAFLALTLTLPGLIVQDAWRFAFFADGRGASAFLNDLIWAVVQLSGFIVAIGFGAGTVFWAVAAWGGGATLAALVGLAQSRVIPRPGAARAWAREHRDLLPSYLGETSAYILAGQLMLYAVGLVSGLATVGVLRATQILLGPLNVVVQGFYLVAVPEAVRVMNLSTRRFVRFCVAGGIALALAALAWTAFLVLVPEGLGRALMGEVWDPAHDVLLLWGLAFAAINLGTGASIGLRALAAAPRTLRAAAVSSVGGFVGAVAGAALAGAPGASWGFLGGQVIGIFVWWAQFQAAIREHRLAADDGDVGVAGRREA